MESLAGELLAIAPYYSSNWNYGNAIFDGHKALASCAVKEKKIDSAINHINEASKTPGSSQLSTFGPPYRDMSELRDLLTEGHNKKLKVPLSNLKRFWDSEFSQDYFDFWQKEIEQNRIPKFDAGEGDKASKINYIFLLKIQK